MKKFILHYALDVTETVYAESEDDACDMSSFPEADIYKVEDLGEVHEE